MYGNLEKQLGIKRKDISKLVDIISKCNEDKDQMLQQIQQMQEAHRIAVLHEEEEMRVEDVENTYEDDEIRRRAAEERVR